MTYEEFKKKVIRANWYDKYFYYLLLIALIAAGIFFFYDLYVDPIKYKSHRTYIPGYFLAGFMIFLGAYGFYLIPNRYKILTISSKIDLERKAKIIEMLISKFRIRGFENSNAYYCFNYKVSFWNYGYKTQLSFDAGYFYISVQGRTGGYYGSGFIDFGGTEKVRKQIVNEISQLITDNQT